MCTKNFQMFKLDLETAEEPKIKLPTSAGSSKKEESSRKTLLIYWWAGSGPKVVSCGTLGHQAGAGLFVGRLFLVLID